MSARPGLSSADVVVGVGSHVQAFPAGDATRHLLECSVVGAGAGMVSGGNQLAEDLRLGAVGTVLGYVREALLQLVEASMDQAAEFLAGQAHGTDAKSGHRQDG